MADKEFGGNVYILLTVVIVVVAIFLSTRLNGYTSLAMETTSQTVRQGPQIEIFSPNGGTLRGHVDTFFIIQNEWLNNTLRSLDLYLVDESAGGETTLIGNIQGLELRDGSFTKRIAWDSSNFENGVYHLKAVLRDDQNNYYTDFSDGLVTLDNSRIYPSRGTGTKK